MQLEPDARERVESISTYEASSDSSEKVLFQGFRKDVQRRSFRVLLFNVLTTSVQEFSDNKCQQLVVLHDWNQLNQTLCQVCARSTLLGVSPSGLSSVFGESLSLLKVLSIVLRTLDPAYRKVVHGMVVLSHGDA